MVIYIYSTDMKEALNIESEAEFQKLCAILQMDDIDECNTSQKDIEKLCHNINFDEELTENDSKNTEENMSEKNNPY